MKVRSTFYKFPAEITSEEKDNIFKDFDINTEFCDTTSEEIPCSVKTAKMLVKSYGGEAYTKFIDRSGKPYQILPLIVGKSKLREIREKAGISSVVVSPGSTVMSVNAVGDTFSGFSIVFSSLPLREDRHCIEAFPVRRMFFKLSVSGCWVWSGFTTFPISIVSELSS